MSTRLTKNLDAAYACLHLAGLAADIVAKRFEEFDAPNRHRRHSRDYFDGRPGTARDCKAVVNLAMAVLTGDRDSLPQQLNVDAYEPRVKGSKCICKRCMSGAAVAESNPPGWESLYILMTWGAIHLDREIGRLERLGHTDFGLLDGLCFAVSVCQNGIEGEIFWESRRTKGIITLGAPIREAITKAIGLPLSPTSYKPSRRATIAVA